MKKKVLLATIVIMITGCADKQEYEQAVLDYVNQDKDLKDYKIAPEIMTKCVVTESSNNMPGLFAADPERMLAYRHYSKMLKLNSSNDPKKTLEELRTEFGSPKALADAHANFTETFMNCMSGLVSDTEEKKKN